jgi:hypothetical protein
VPRTKADVDLKDIKNSWGDTYGSIKNGLRTMVFDAFSRSAKDSPSGPSDLPTSWYEQCSDPDSVVQLLKDGTFAQQVDYGNPATPNGITASLASVAINYMWSQQNVIVVKISKASLGFDPCEGDVLFNSDVKYCKDGVMYVVPLALRFTTTNPRQVRFAAVELRRAVPP